MSIIGPLAIKTDADNYIWIKITIDAQANLLNYFEAIDFTHNQWHELPMEQLQTKLIAYDPVENSAWCMVIKKVGDSYRAHRFLFRNLNDIFLPLPHGDSCIIINQKELSWTQDLTQKSRGIITSDDYWIISPTIADLIHQEYASWIKVVDPKWHQGESCPPLDLPKLHQAVVAKGEIITCLTSYQQSQIRNTVCYDWETLKEESKDSHEYCQALSLIMTGELSENIMQEMQFSIETQANAPAVRFYLHADTFDKYGNNFYSEPIGRDSTIADMHDYLIALMQQEINQYYPEMQVNITYTVPAAKVGRLEEYRQSIKLTTTEGIFKFLRDYMIGDGHHHDIFFNRIEIFLQNELPIESVVILRELIDFYARINIVKNEQQLIEDFGLRKLAYLLSIDLDNRQVSLLMMKLMQNLDFDTIVHFMPHDFKKILLKKFFQDGVDVILTREQRIFWTMYFINNYADLSQDFLRIFRPWYLALIDEQNSENNNQICAELIEKTSLYVAGVVGKKLEYIIVHNDIFKTMGNSVDMRDLYFRRVQPQDSLTYLQLICNQDFSITMQLLKTRFKKHNFRTIFPQYIYAIISRTQSRYALGRYDLGLFGVKESIYKEAIQEYLYMAIKKLHALKLQVVNNKLIIIENQVPFDDLLELINENSIVVVRALLLCVEQLNLVKTIDLLLNIIKSQENPTAILQCKEKLDVLIDVILNLLASEDVDLANISNIIAGKERALNMVLSMPEVDIKINFAQQIQNITALSEQVRMKYAVIIKESDFLNISQNFLSKCVKYLENIEEIASNASPFALDYKKQCVVFFDEIELLRYKTYAMMKLLHQLSHIVVCRMDIADENCELLCDFVMKHLELCTYVHKHLRIMCENLEEREERYFFM